jgi:hypothetical protein
MHEDNHRFEVESKACATCHTDDRHPRQEAHIGSPGSQHRGRGKIRPARG